jgi:hypothetical protein
MTDFEMYIIMATILQVTMAFLVRHCLWDEIALGLHCSRIFTRPAS